MCGIFGFEVTPDQALVQRDVRDLLGMSFRLSEVLSVTSRIPKRPR